MYDYDPSWPGQNEAAVVDEMVRDDNSPHWEKCDGHIKHRLLKLYADVQAADRDWIANKVLEAVRRKLPAFRHESTLKGWILKIIYNKVTDFFRERGRQQALSLEQIQKASGDVTLLVSTQPQSLEEECIERELWRRLLQLRPAFLAGQQKHNRARDGQIFDWFFSKAYGNGGGRAKEIAAALHISEQIVNNVLYEVREFLRGHLHEILPDGDSSLPSPEVSNPNTRRDKRADETSRQQTDETNPPEPQATKKNPVEIVETAKADGGVQ